jgi:hypothetical protein
LLHENRKLSWITALLLRATFTDEALADPNTGPGYADHALYPVRGGVGEPTAARALRWERPARRSAQFTRDELLNMAREAGIKHKRMGRYPRSLLYDILCRQGAIGNAKIVWRFNQR